MKTNLHDTMKFLFVKAIWFVLFVYYNQLGGQVNSDVFWLDLCKPSGPSSISTTSGKNKLETNWKNTMTFGLLNCNHFKYEYSINSIPFASFVDTSYSSFSSSIKTTNLVYEDPFVFELREVAVYKKKYRELLDDLNNLEGAYQELDSIFIDFKIRNNFVDSLYKYVPSLKPQQTREENKILGDISNNLTAISKVESELFGLLSVKTQKAGLNEIVIKLISLGSDSAGSETLTGILQDIGNDINELPVNLDNELYERGNYQGSLTDHYGNGMLQIYQQIAQIIRIYLGRTETKYNEEIVKFLAEECNSISNVKIEKIDDLIYKFNVLNEIFFGLQELYYLNPLESAYFEEYISIERKYFTFLTERLTTLKKIININSVYFMPMSSNMKNYDRFSVTIEKKNRFTNEKDLYNYEVFIRGGIKIDFSAGIFGTALINHLYSTIDSLNENLDPTSYSKIRRIDNGNVNVGFGGMVNVTLRTGASWLSPGVSFGLIASTQPSLQFVSGLSLGIGKSERILVHAGYAFGFAKRIDGLPLNEYIPTIRIGEEVRTVDKFLVKPFIGLTYNLSKNNVFKMDSFSSSN